MLSHGDAATISTLSFLPSGKTSDAEDLDEASSTYSDHLTVSLPRSVQITHLRTRWEEAIVPTVVTIQKYVRRMIARKTFVEKVSVPSVPAWLDLDKLNQFDGDNLTPLMRAAKTNDLHTVQAIIGLTDKNLGVNLQRADGWTALHFAVENNNVEIVKVILTRPEVDINLRELHDGSAWGRSIVDIMNPNQAPKLDPKIWTWGNTPLHLAVLNRNNEIANLLLDREDIDVSLHSRKLGFQVLHLAIGTDNIELLKRLVQRTDVDVNVSTPERSTYAPLIQLAQGGDYNLGPVENGLEMFKILLESPRTNVNVQDAGGKTALHFAVFKIEFAQVLLARDDIDVNIVDLDGNSALHHAALNDGPECTRLLLARPELNPNIQNAEGETAVFWCWGLSADHIAAFLERPDTDVDLPDNVGETVLDKAVAENNVEAIQILSQRSSIKSHAQLKEIRATAGFPQNRQHGIIISNKASPTISKVMDNSWAAKYTTLSDCIGWRIVKVNSHDIKTTKDFGKYLLTVKPGDTIHFTLQNVKISNDKVMYARQLGIKMSDKVMNLLN